METVTIQMDDTVGQLWNSLPKNAQLMITENAIKALLNGTLYPTGTAQMELAIALAEAGVATETISKLTRLDSDLFASFISKK